MGAHSVRKRCRDCRRSRNGTPGKAEWCDCGGELTAIPYGRQSRRKGAAGRNGRANPGGNPAST